MSDSDVLAVLNDLTKLLRRHLENGEIVRFGDFGDFRISLSSEEKFHPSIIKRGKVTVLNRRLWGMNKAEKQQVRPLQGYYLPRLVKYESQLEILAGRNFFGKTEADATFMRMK